MSEPFVYEFLFRGNDPNTSKDDVWHVILGRYVVDIAGTRKLELTDALPPERAEQLGFSLERIVEELNGKAISAAASVRDMAEKLAACEQALEVANERLKQCPPA